jgi:hypothetical protein
MAAGRTSDEVERLPDEYERQMTTLARLVAARGVGRYASFWEVGEGTFLPDGTEDLSGYVVDEHGRVFFFWTAWDAERDEPAFETWRQVEPEPHWADSEEYREARAVVGLDAPSPTR